VEDFLNVDSEMVYVSTIHKAKGKEFDNVYLLLKNFTPAADEDKRQLYVAITRAKTNLSIHYSDTYLKPFAVDGLTYIEDPNIYPEPQQIAIYLTLRDVQLWYFDRVQLKLKDLFSGSRLIIREDGLADPKGDLMLMYAQNFRGVLKGWYDKGFKIAAAKINYVVYWKGEDMEKEVKIVLPVLLLKRG
jgi:ATP-dependent DNA helicase RecQ